MKREILFRGKTKSKDSKWITGDLNHVYDAIFIFDRVNESELNSPDNYEVIPDTVGQFAGLTDKNGIKIFEGDVCDFKICSGKYQQKEVKYHHYGFFVGDYPVGGDCKVIGNIHDNPELIS